MKHKKIWKKIKFWKKNKKENKDSARAKVNSERTGRKEEFGKIVGKKKSKTSSRRNLKMSVVKK